MRENDVVFFNLHRRYINTQSNYGGFLGIFLLAAFLNDNGYASQAFAGQLVEGKGLIDEVCQNGKAQMIGLYCDFENVTENIFLSKYIKEQYHLPVIVGGPQATALGYEFLQRSQCDAVVRYEGELTVLELTAALLDGDGDLGGIDGIMYLAEGRVAINQERALIENLDALPFITDECFLQPSKREASLSIMTGRGCPFHCAFCHEGAHTKRVRLRSVENVVAEIQAYMDARPKLTELFIMFTDDTFTLIPERVRQICAAIAKWQTKLRIRWFCEAHVHTLHQHPEMIEYLAGAQCQRVQLGIEAGTQKVLDAFRKGSTPEEIKEVVRLCEQHGIQQVYSNIILGAAFFDKEVFAADLAFAKELLEIGRGIMEFGGVSYWPLPETAITKCPERYHIQIADYDFVTSVGDFAQVYTEELTTWDISSLVKRFDAELMAYKKEMLSHQRVPHERIMGWHDRRSKSSVYGGRWWLAIREMPQLHAYYSMLASGEACRSLELSDDDYLAAHPMRVHDIAHSLSWSAAGGVLVNGHPMDDVDKEIYPLCTGKLSVREIAQRLASPKAAGKCANMEPDRLMAAIKQRLQGYEAAYLIVFSRY